MLVPKTVLKPPFNVTRASHAVLRVADLGRARAFYADALGFLITAETADTLYLRGLEEACHHSLVLKRAGTPGAGRVGFRVFTEDDLAGIATHFERAGLAVRWVDVPHQSKTLQVTDPVGVPLEFCVSMETQPRAVNQFGAFKGGCPMRLDHFQILSPKVRTAWEFYAALGFRTSEYIVDETGTQARAIFLQRKGNPHDLVFMHGAGPRLHHIAFTCPEAQHLMHACDVLASAGFGNLVEHGPGRHFGPGYARFLYLRDPDGHRIELFNNHYQTMDIEDEPIRWDGALHGAASRWGRPPVPSWREEASVFADDPSVADE